MPEDPWTVLDIAPGAPADAIRRAYVAQLKAIDVDADSAAFMRLREAYDAALGGDVHDGGSPSTEPVLSEVEGLRSAQDDKEARERYVAPAAEPAVPGRANVVAYGALSEANATFEALIEAGDTREAAAFLERILAQGIVPLGGEDAFVRALTACALTDDALSADELSGIAATFHAAEAGERADALRWRARIESDAARAKGMRGGWARYAVARTRIARALLLGMVKHDLLSGDLPALRIELKTAARFSRWFPEFIDVVKAEKELTRLERTLRGQEVLAIIGIAVILVLVGVARGLSGAP